MSAAIVKEGKMGPVTNGPVSGNVSTAAPLERRGPPAVLLQVGTGEVGPSRVCPNPRKRFEAQAMAELTGSVLLHGVLQPLIVRKFVESGEKGKSASKSKEQEQEFELVAGERRWRAAVAAKLATIPVLVSELTDGQVREVQHIENLQREGLTPLEEAESYQALIATGAYSAETLAQKLGVDRTTIFNRLRLLKMKKAVRAALEQGEIDTTMAGLIAKVPTEDGQAEALDDIAGDRMSFREAKEYIEDKFYKNLSGAPWKWEEADLVKKAGACKTCPKLSGNIPGNEGAKSLCTDPECYQKKQEAWGSRQLAEAKKSGLKVIENWRGHDAALLDPEEERWIDDCHQSIREALGKQLPKPSALAMSQDGRTLGLVDRKDCEALLNKKFKTASHGSRSDDGESWRKQQAAQRKKHQFRARIVEKAIVQIRAKARTASGPKFWETLAKMLLEAGHWDPIREMMKARGIKDPKSGGNRSKPLQDALKEEGDHREAVVEYFTRDFAFSSYSNEFGKNLKTACAWAGVDLAKVERELKKEKKESKRKSRITSKKGKTAKKK